MQSPFFYFTLGTALLGGLLYGYAGAAVFSLLLVAVYVWSLDVRADVDQIPDTFQTYVGLPALYPLVAAAGAAARRLLDRQAEAESELAEEQGRAAAEAERARLARDMHDSLAKTVSGIGFAALALSRRIERDPEGATTEARRLAEDARQATRQAREIIVGLRADSGETLPIALGAGDARAALGGGDRRRCCSSRSRRSASCTRRPRASWSGSSARRWPTASAMRGRTASACGCAGSARGPCSRWSTTASASTSPTTSRTLAGGRHFGVGGMRERALLVGGDLSVESAPATAASSRSGCRPRSRRARRRFPTSRCRPRPAPTPAAAPRRRGTR